MGIVTLFSCDGTTTNMVSPKPEDTLQIMPLTVDNYWTYITENFDSFSRVTSTNTFTVTVTFDSKHNDSIYYYLDAYSIFYINRADGLWEFDNLHSKRLAKYPCAIGDSVRYDTMSYQGLDRYGNVATLSANGLTSVVSLSSKISLPDSAYYCIEYSADYRFLKVPREQSHRLIDYYAPGIGLIRREFYLFRSGGYHLQWRNTLVSRKIN